MKKYQLNNVGVYRRVDKNIGKIERNYNRGVKFREKSDNL